MAAAGSRPTQENQEKRNSKLTTAEMTAKDHMQKKPDGGGSMFKNGEMKAGKSYAAYAAQGQQNAKPRYIAREWQSLKFIMVVAGS